MNAMIALVMFAARRSSVQSSPEVIIAAVIVVAVIFVIVFIRQLIENKKQAERQRELDNYHGVKYRQWRMRIQKTGQITPVPCSLMMKKGEECLHVAHGVTLYEIRSVRHSTHSFGSVPIGRSRMRVGGGETTSRSTDEWTAIATGDLYVTNKQLYFDGDKQDRKIPIGKIATIKADVSAIEVSAETRQRSMIFKDCNGQIVRDMVQLASQQ